MKRNNEVILPRSMTLVPCIWMLEGCDVLGLQTKETASVFLLQKLSEVVLRTLLVTWNPSYGHCHQAAPQVPHHPLPCAFTHPHPGSPHLVTSPGKPSLSPEGPPSGYHITPFSFAVNLSSQPSCLRLDSQSPAPCLACHRCWVKTAKWTKWT